MTVVSKIFGYYDFENMSNNPFETLQAVANRLRETYPDTPLEMKVIHSVHNPDGPLLPKILPGRCKSVDAGVGSQAADNAIIRDITYQLGVKGVAVALITRDSDFVDILKQVFENTGNAPTLITDPRQCAKAYKQLWRAEQLTVWDRNKMLSNKSNVDAWQRNKRKKRKICADFQHGRCHRASKCRYTHARSCDTPCRNGKSCKFGKKCRYKHEVPLKAIACIDFRIGRCQRGDECRFEHGRRPRRASESNAPRRRQRRRSPRTT